MSKKTQNGGENINSGGVLQHWAHLGPSGSFNSCSPGQACCFWRKPSTRLGELSGKLLPYFGYKRVWKAEGKGFNTLGKHISLKISEKEGERKEIGNERNKDESLKKKTRNELKVSDSKTYPLKNEERMKNRGKPSRICLRKHLRIVTEAPRLGFS